MPTPKSYRSKGDVSPETALPKASTDFFPGYWLQSTSAGSTVEPLAPTSVVVGLCLSLFTSGYVGATEYAAPTKQISYDGVTDTTDRFIMPVTNGTASATSREKTFDIFTDFFGLDVATGGTQFKVTQVFSSTLVEVEVAKNH